MKALKTLLTVSILILFAGCATVTDANIDLIDENEPSVTTTTVDDNDWFSRTGDGMDPIIDGPDDQI